VVKQIFNGSTNVFIDPPLEVQLWGKWNYEINMRSQSINNSTLKNLCQVKQETHVNKKRLNINLVQLLWLDLDQERINEVLLLSIDIYESNLIIRRSFSRMSLWKTWSDVWDNMVSWRRINEDLAMMNHASVKSKWKSWRWETVCDGEGQVDVQSEELSLLWRIIYH
jgi:hypothetical protein